MLTIAATGLSMWTLIFESFEHVHFNHSSRMPGRLMAGQRPLEPSVEVRVLPGQLPNESRLGYGCKGITGRTFLGE